MSKVQQAFEKASQAISKLPEHAISPQLFQHLFDLFCDETWSEQDLLIAKWPSPQHVLSLRGGKLWWLNTTVEGNEPTQFSGNEENQNEQTV